jgi:FkbM family methyltransferase
LKTKRGKIIDAFENDAITKEIQSKGEYDANALDSLSETLAAIQPRTSLDVGANIGNHVLIIADYSKRVIAFEPVGFIYEVLEKNIVQNHADNVEPVNVGLSDQTGKAEIFIPDNANLGSSTLEKADGAGYRLTIGTVVGDQYIAQHTIESIDFIKMDVEGHEVPAILGLEKTIRQNQPLLLLEYNNQATIDGFESGALFSTIFSGYAVFSVTTSSSKKIHGHGAMGALKRIYYKYLAKKWVLSSFNPEGRYSNIYLVTPRFKPVFERFRFMKSSDSQK